MLTILLALLALIRRRLVCLDFILLFFVSLIMEYTARFLRLLATHHIFTETRPNVFANNRVSAVLEKGQDVDVLIKK